MQFRKTVIGFLTVLLLVVAVICGCVCAETYTQDQIIQEPIPVLFQMETDEFTQEIVPWYDGLGKYYVFLPSCGSLDNLKIAIQGNKSVYLGDKLLENGASCDYLSLEQEYAVSYTHNKETVESAIIFLKSENLPAVYVDTRSGDMKYIHSLKGSEEPGQLRIIFPDGRQHYSGNLRSFGGRGNATWEQEKKSYKLELQQEEDILGMGAANKWILLSNAFDPSHIRNKSVYDTAKQLNLAFSPDSAWVDLYLNGEYAGLYLLCEKNEIHPQRVSIDESTAVLISIEKEDRLWEYGGDQFITGNGIPIRIRYNNAEAALLKEKLQSAENAILASDGIDLVTGKYWTELVDAESWARKYLIEEIFGNLDAGSISQFFYWEGDGKIYAGPVWDYDICMGNPNNWQLESPQMLFAGRPNLWNPEDTPWFYALYQKDSFREMLAQLYEEQFRPVLQELIDSGFSQYGMQISAAASLDRIRWSTDDCMQTIEAMQLFMSERLSFLDNLWLQQEEYHLVSVYIRDHVMACYAMQNGAFFPERAVPDGTDTIIYEDWYDGDTDQPFDFSDPITGNKLIYLKEINLLADRNENNGFSLRKAITYVPLAVLLAMVLGMLAVDRINKERSEGHIHEQSKISP